MILDPDNDNVQVIFNSGRTLLFSQIWQAQRLLVLNPNNKTDIGIHLVSIVLQDDNRWVKS